MLLEPVLPRPRFHRAATWGALAFCAVLAARGVRKGLRAGGNDFTIYYDSARALLEGRDPLLVQGSIYLPSFDVALVPFGALPYGAALVLWQSASLLGLLWAWRRALQAVAEHLGDRPWVPWVSLFAVARLADSSFAYGQVNTLTLALVAEAIHRLRRAEAWRAGLAVGAGAALKILPGFLILWFLLRRAWRAALAASVATAVLIVLPPVLAMGPARAADSFRTWRDHVLEPVGSGGASLVAFREYVPGQSLTAACYRLLSATPATSAGPAGPRANLLDLPLETTHRILLALTAAHLAAFAATVRFRGGRTSPEREHRFPLEAGLCIAMVLALGPVVQKAHMVWLLWPYAALLAVPTRLAGPWRDLRHGLVGLSIFLVAGTAPALLGDAVATRLVSGNVVFLGLECALGALLVELWAPDRPKSEVGAGR